MDYIYFTQYSKDFLGKNRLTNGYSIFMNEYFIMDFESSPIMKSYRDFPKDLKITVGSKTFTVMKFVYDNIRKIKNQPTSPEGVILNVDNESIFSLIIDLINGRIVCLSYKESLLFRVISKDLGFYPIYNCLCEHNEETSINLIISPLSLITNLKNQPKNFTINTKNNSYKCSKIAAAVSKVIMAAIKADNSIDSYFYDFDDDNNEFQIICQYLNFEEIEIVPENIEILNKMASDLKLEELEKVTVMVADHQKRFEQVLIENQDKIDSVDELFEMLVSKDVNEGVDFVVGSGWMATDELQKEMFGSIISLVYSSPKLMVKMAKFVALLFERIESIKENSEDKNFAEIDLKLLKNFFLRRVIDSAEDSHNGPFIYELIKLNFIKLRKDSNKADQEVYKSHDKDSKDDDCEVSNLVSDDFCDDDSDLLTRCVKYQFTAIWILPELDEIVQNLQNYFNCLKEPEFYPVSQFLGSDYRQNDWEKLRQFRDDKQSTSQISIALANDDIDEFQKLLYLPQAEQSISRPTVQRGWLSPFKLAAGMRNVSKQSNEKSDKNDLINGTVPYFEFDLYSDVSYINYAAFHGSIQCFKFLLMNGAKVTNFTFDAAIEGGNIEIVRITEQKLNELGDDSYYNGKIEVNKRGRIVESKPLQSHSFSHYCDDMINNRNGLERAIYKHNNDIFDWIFENKKIKRSELNNLLLIASLCNNLHVVSLILSEKPSISNLKACKSFLKSVNNAASLGFALLVKILIQAFGEENFKDYSNQFDSFDNDNVTLNSYEKTYVFDNVEIFKMTYFKEKDFQLLFNLCKCNSLSIFKFCYDESCNKKFSEFLINFSIKNNNEAIFNFLFNQINQDEDDIQQEILLKKLLKNTVKCNCLPIFRRILTICKPFKKLMKTMTKCLIIAAKNGYENIFQYILNWIKTNSDSIENDHKYFVNEISKNLFEIFQSGSLTIIKSIIHFIDNESYIKMMMFDLLVKESNKMVVFDSTDSNRFNRMTYTKSSNYGQRIKSIFSIKKVTEFLICYTDKVIPEFLFAATKVGNIEAVKAIVKKNSSYDFLNQVFSASGNALSIACSNDFTEIAKFLLNSCPEIDPTFSYPSNAKYVSPLIISVSRQNFELVQAIIQFCQSKEKSFNSPTKEKVKENPFVKEIQVAISTLCKERSEINLRKFEEIVSYLLTIEGIDINEIYCGDDPFLYFISDDNFIGVFNLVLSLPNVNPNIYEYRMKETPLIKSIREGQNKIVLALLNHKDIDINVESFSHLTALLIAVFKNNLNVVDLLVNNPKLKVENNLNYSACLYYAIKSKSIEIVKLLLKRTECNVNEIIPFSYINILNEEKLDRFNRHNFILNPRNNHNNNNNNNNPIQKRIDSNISILENESKYHSVSIIQAAAASENLEIVNDVVNHPRFVPQKSTLILAIFESVKNNNSEIFDLLMSLYMQINGDFDVLNFFDLSFNSIVVIASSSNNIDFINLIPEFIKSKGKQFSSFYENQLAFIVAPSIEMMNLIIETLPGVDLSLPLEDGSNYLTALIDFYLNPLNSVEKDNENRYMNPDADHFVGLENIVIEKVEFILAHSNLKITTKDKNGFSFITKATSRAHCVHYLKMASLIYSRFTPQNDDIKESFLIDEETRMNPLHLISSNLQLLSFYSNNKVSSRLPNNSTNNNFYECEDDFDVLVNLIIIENFSNVVVVDECFNFRKIFEKNSSIFNNNRLNYIDNDLNSVDILNQTPIIKAILNMNVFFANFLFSECNVKIDVVDVFENTFVDYLLMVVEHFLDSFQRIARMNPSIDYRVIIEKRKKKEKITEIENERELCSLIFGDLLKYFSNDNPSCNLMESNLIVTIIIKLSAYLVKPKK
ncbi:hypothetical protein M9Y10_007196 [Tritrichomonas musculus]|uniref:Uncharacterized protein n=1 Tax=Tritrichomonas musculus TaxID=1915356 RepID=A0ABR2J0N2_9EUKA